MELIQTALIKGERGTFENTGAPIASLAVHASGRIGQRTVLDGRAQRRWVAPGAIDLVPAGSHIGGED